MPVTSLAVPTPVPGELKLTSANTWYPLQANSSPCTKVRLSAPTELCISQRCETDLAVRAQCR
jgi:hypothetical protein